MTGEAPEQLVWQAIQSGAYEEAVRLLRPLVERNSEYALLTLGWVYETGATGAPDKEAGRLYYEHAAALGSASAYHSLGRVLLDQGNEPQARAAFERGIQLNDDECKSALAQLNDSAEEQLADQAIKKGDYEEALCLLRPLAERNSANALLALGWICETGAIGAPDKDAARSYYERAAVEGGGSAYHELGRLLSGQGQASEARVAFQAGAECGDIPCMARLGRMMVEGRGGPEDIAAGSAWLGKAAAQGHVFARRILLGIELSNARSIFRKLFVRMKILSFATRAAREFIKGRDSNKLRW
ncbi:MAG TPA: tetratricopeptide repeat protein [Allosphingosinicella sp.]|jgi:hypothetical protein|nr:tetratricopeptide repeat protein [Allosphingosinicella sp.]